MLSLAPGPMAGRDSLSVGFLRPRIPILPIQAIRTAQDETRKRTDLEKTLSAAQGVARAAQSAQGSDAFALAADPPPGRPRTPQSPHRGHPSGREGERTARQEREQAAEAHRLKERAAALQYRCDELSERNEALSRQLELSQKARFAASLS